MPTESTDSAGPRLNDFLASAGLPLLSADQKARFEAYLGLFVRWNGRTNLSSVREPEAILSRHFVESIACANSLPQGISTLLDYGSGGGLPGIPIALCRPEILVTLAESQGKKAAFLQEAVRTLGLAARVFADRAERLPDRFDCVTLRAVDRMGDAVRLAARLASPGGWMALMTTRADVAELKVEAGPEFEWREELPLPGSIDRILALGKRIN
jgi:16S rRNA (guanine527-N7)-methyltransferase